MENDMKEYHFTRKYRKDLISENSKSEEIESIKLEISNKFIWKKPGK